jgi:hypothetical protein
MGHERQAKIFEAEASQVLRPTSKPEARRRGKCHTWTCILSCKLHPMLRTSMRNHFLTTLSTARILMKRILSTLRIHQFRTRIHLFYATCPPRADLNQGESPLTCKWSLHSQSLVQLLACFQWQKSYICSWDMVLLTAYYMLFLM